MLDVSGEREAEAKCSMNTNCRKLFSLRKHSHHLCSHHLIYQTYLTLFLICLTPHLASGICYACSLFIKIVCRSISLLVKEVYRVLPGSTASKTPRVRVSDIQDFTPAILPDITYYSFYWLRFSSLHLSLD